MRAFNNLILRWSGSWWVFIAASLASYLSLESLFWIGDRFALVTNGYQPFDLTNPLYLKDVFAQLPAYTTQSKVIYWWFIAADMIFPIVASLPLALAFARLLIILDTPRTKRWLGAGIALTPFWKAGVVDWVENAFFVATVALYPGDITFWAVLAVGTKAVKIGFLILFNVILTGLAAFIVVRFLVTRWQTSRAKRAAKVEPPS